MKLLLDFLGEPDSKFTFENDQNKGFSCLKEPLPFCLNPAKGNSRKEDVYDIYKAKGFIFFNNFIDILGLSGPGRTRLDRPEVDPFEIR